MPNFLVRIVAEDTVQADTEDDAIREVAANFRISLYGAYEPIATAEEVTGDRTIDSASALLTQAADKLQELAEGDVNDPLAMKIRRFIQKGN